jgi:hypothetical protein
MQKRSEHDYICPLCGNKIEPYDKVQVYKLNTYYHYSCWNNREKEPKVDHKADIYNNPDHYHKHDIDTIEFLKRGFPPQVLTGFLIGNIIKYTQRFEYKNGEDDLVKVVDYAKRLQEWYKETHS